MSHPNGTVVHVAHNSGSLEAAYGALYREAQRGRTGVLRARAMDSGLTLANAMVWVYAAAQVAHVL